MYLYSFGGIDSEHSRLAAYSGEKGVEVISESTNFSKLNLASMSPVPFKIPGTGYEKLSALIEKALKRMADSDKI